MGHGTMVGCTQPTQRLRGEACPIRDVSAVRGGGGGADRGLQADDKVTVEDSPGVGGCGWGCDCFQA